MLLLDNAIVLRTIDYGEADRICTFLTHQYGKVTAIAKGAKRSYKRFGGGLSVFACGEASFKQRPQQDLWILESFQASQTSATLPYEMSRFAQASYACELVRELCPPTHPEPMVYTLLWNLLQTLDKIPVTQSSQAEPLLAFELQTLQALGVGLIFNQCTSCGQLVYASVPNQSIFVDIQGGGVVCSNCASRNKGRLIPLHRDAQAALLSLSQTPLEHVLHEHLPPLVLKEIRKVLLEVIYHHVGKMLQTVEFIEQMNKR